MKLTEMNKNRLIKKLELANAENNQILRRFLLTVGSFEEERKSKQNAIYELDTLVAEAHFLYEQLFKVQEQLEKTLLETREARENIMANNKKISALNEEVENLKNKNFFLRGKASEAEHLLSRNAKAIMKHRKKLIRPAKFEKILGGIAKKDHRIAQEVELIVESDLFDTDWYLIRNPDVALSRIGAAEHYLLFGGREGRDPSSKFSSSDYLENNSDVESSNVNPLLHYLKFGQKEGRAIYSAI